MYLSTSTVWPVCDTSPTIYIVLAFADLNISFLSPHLAGTLSLEHSAMEHGMTDVLRQTKEMSQYRRNTSNYGTCKECLMCYMIIMHMSPYDT
jgi:hypothetical protein